MQIAPRQNTPTKHDEIAAIAFILWEQAGRPAGRDQEFWFFAEQRVLATHDALADTPRTSHSRSKISSSPAMKFATEPTGETRSRSTGTNSSHENNGKKSTSEPTIRLGQTREKRTTSSEA
jgi:hypothetical protein